MLINLHEFVQKEFRIGPMTFEYPLNLIPQNSKKWHKSQESSCRWKIIGCNIIEIIWKLLSNNF